MAILESKEEIDKDIQSEMVKTVPEAKIIDKINNADVPPAILLVTEFPLSDELLLAVETPILFKLPPNNSSVAECPSDELP